MKVFISWSGELSKQVAEILKKKLPVIIQSIKPFVSATDIQKGENWDARITSELSDTTFCIVCLTHENVTAPWVHFEAGAASQKFGGRVSALMIGLNPSDLQGPLSRFQATKFTKAEVLLLVQSINSFSESPIDNELLNNSFDFVWPTLEKEIQEALNEHQNSSTKKIIKKDDRNNIAIEEILSLVRKQSTFLANPENLFPLEYLQNTIGAANSESYSNDTHLFIFIDKILAWAEGVFRRTSSLISTEGYYILKTIEIEALLVLINSLSREFSPSRNERINKRVNSLMDGITFYTTFIDLDKTEEDRNYQSHQETT